MPPELPLKAPLLALSGGFEAGRSFRVRRQTTKRPRFSQRIRRFESLAEWRVRAIYNADWCLAPARHGSKRTSRDPVELTSLAAQRGSPARSLRDPIDATGPLPSVEIANFP